jgi:hypothetical protein
MILKSLQDLFSHIVDNAYSKKKMSKTLLNSSRSPQPVWKHKLKQAGRAIQIWLRNLIYSLIEITILFTVTAVLVGILLSLLEAFWYLYLETPIGIKFTADPSRLSPHLLTQLFKQDLFLFSVEIATATLTACLVISFAFQILALRRYFYSGRGLLNRFIVLLLFSAAGAFNLAHTGQINPLVAFGVSIVPSLCLFPSCMNISARIFPELTPLGIMEIIIDAKKFLTHSGDRAIPDPQASLSPACGGNLQPCSALNAKPSAKIRGAGRVKPNASGIVQ